MSSTLNPDLPFRDPAVPLSEAARELRRLVDKQVSSDPESLGMLFWEVRMGTSPCGTTRCLAGWAQFYGDGHVSRDGEEVQARAVALLELTQDEYLGEGERKVPLFFQFSGDKARERMHALAQA